MADSSRVQRVADQIQRELAVLIQQEMKDPRVSLVTVSGVQVSRDLAFADIYVTQLNQKSEVDQQKLVELLNHAAGFLRGRLAKAIRLRISPSLRFHYDQTMDRGRYLSSLIDQAIAADEQHKKDDDVSVESDQ